MTLLQKERREGKKEGEKGIKKEKKFKPEKNIDTFFVLAQLQKVLLILTKNIKRLFKKEMKMTCG